MFKCVPLNPAWTSETKLDLHGIYDRGNGDLCTLPLRRHHQWAAKGFTYVTLADAESLEVAAKRGLVDWQSYVVGRDGDGRPTCWNAAAYLAERNATKRGEEAELKALIEQYGVEQVEAIKGVKIPDHLRPTPTPEPAKRTAKAAA